MSDQAIGGKAELAEQSAGVLSRGAPRVLFGATLAIVVWIAAAPFIMLIYSSFASDKNKLPFEANRLSFDNYAALLADPDNLAMLANTAIFAIGATALGSALAIFFAWLIERTDVFGRRFLFVAMLTPMAIPSMIYAMAWIQLCGPNNGLVNATLAGVGLGALQINILSLGGMIVVQGIALASHAYLLIAIAFRNFDSSFEEQAFMCGRGWFSTVAAITLPMLRPALLAAGLFFAVVSLETFDIPITLGLTSHVRVASTQIYWDTHPESGSLPDYGASSALAVWLVAIALGLISLYNRATRDARRFVSVTARGFRPRPIPLGAWRWPLFGVAMLFVLAAVGLPLFILVWRSLLRFYQYPSAAAFHQVSLAAYGNIFNDPDMPKVMVNTLLVTIGGAGAVTLLAAAVGWQATRGPASPAWRRRLSATAFFPQSIPGVVVGLSLIFVYLWLPIPIYGTLWIIGLAMATRFLAYSAGAVIAAHTQISPELEEAARASGAGAARVYWRVALPLVLPTLLATFLWVSIHVVRELGLSLMLYTLQSQVLSTKIWLLWENGRVADACATGVMTVLALLALLGAAALAAGARGAARRALRF